MSRPTRLTLGALSLFLVLFPLTLADPGIPSGLKADEPAYYLMALSLAHDGDLQVTPRDLRRLVDEFPFSPTRNLILASDDGWRTVYFGKPYAYSLLAAPAAGLFGADGLLAFNMALMMAMVWMGTAYLSRFNRSGVAALFSTGFFLLSAGFAYVFWLHPEVLNMAGVTACLFLLLHRFEGEPPDGVDEAPADAGEPRRGRLHALRRLLWSGGSRALLSGAALGLAVYNKPMLLAFALPAAALFLHRGGWRRLLIRGAAWALGLALCLGVLAGVSWGLTGHPTAYLGMARGSFEVCDPDVMPILPTPEAEGGEPAARAGGPKVAATGGRGTGAGSGTGEGTGAEAEADEGSPEASWSWIFGIPDLRPWELLENVTYFFVGRHTGLLLYFPFALLAVLLFLLHARRSVERWAVAAALAVVAAFFLLWIPFNWHGGGGFVGNRYYVNAYPAFLFLVTRISPAWISSVGYAAGGLFLGSILFTPIARPGPYPTLQFHTRNAPFEHFPLELSLRQLPGYDTANFGGVQVRGRWDAVLRRGDRFWIRGGTRSELWLTSLDPLPDMVFLVESFARENRVRLQVEDASETLELELTPESGETRRVVLAPEGPTRVRHSDGTKLYVYRLEVAIDTGEIRQYTFHAPPERCSYFAYTPTWEESFYVGAALTFLGTSERVGRDVFGARWLQAETRERVPAGATFYVSSRLANTSGATWPADGVARVAVGYRWIDETGRRVVGEGGRSELEEDVPPGGEVRLVQEVEAPAEPGRYVLELEPLFEHVSWFSRRMGPEAVERLPVRVVPQRTAPPGEDPGEEDPGGGAGRP